MEITRRDIANYKLLGILLEKDMVSAFRKIPSVYIMTESIFPL